MLTTIFCCQFTEDQGNFQGAKVLLTSLGYFLLTCFSLYWLFLRHFAGCSRQFSWLKFDCHLTGDEESALPQSNQSLHPCSRIVLTSLHPQLRIVLVPWSFHPQSRIVLRVGSSTLKPEPPSLLKDSAHQPPSSVEDSTGSLKFPSSVEDSASGWFLCQGSVKDIAGSRSFHPWSRIFLRVSSCPFRAVPYSSFPLVKSL